MWIQTRLKQQQRKKQNETNMTAIWMKIQTTQKNQKHQEARQQ